MINLVGLILGISSVFLLSKYLGFYLTMDDFHEQKDKLYAVHQTLTSKHGVADYAEKTFDAVAPLAKSHFPEVKAMSRYVHTGESLIAADRSDGERSVFNERKIWEVDPDFIRMFSFHFLQGDPQKALDEPNSLILSASMAKKCFGEVNPIGQTITTKKRWGGKRRWTITGVFEDYPLNSKFQFQILQSLVGTDLKEREQGGWTYPDFKSYLLLDDHVEIHALEAKMSGLITSTEAFQVEQEKVTFHLVAFDEALSLSTNQQLLALVGLVLLLITWINYTNLSGAKSLTRGREFGVRRALGSDKSHLIRQFLFEGILVYAVAMMFMVWVIWGTYPLLFDLSGGQMLPVWEMSTPINLAFLALLILGAIGSSVFPSFSVSGLSITGLLKNSKAGRIGSQGFRKALVVFQFTISIIMLVGITTIFQQIQFMTQRPMGFEMDQVMVLKSPKDKWDGRLERMRRVKEALRSQSFSGAVTSSGSIPLWWPGSPTDFQVEGQKEPVRLLPYGVDEAYFDCFELELVAGESFRAEQSKANLNRVLINETAAIRLGYQAPIDALHQRIRNQKTDQSLEIIGVVKDFHQESLRREIKPQVYGYNPMVGFVSIKLNQTTQTSFGALSETIERVEQIWLDISG